MTFEIRPNAPRIYSASTIIWSMIHIPTFSSFNNVESHHLMLHSSPSHAWASFLNRKKERNASSNFFLTQIGVRGGDVQASDETSWDPYFAEKSRKSKKLSKSNLYERKKMNNSVLSSKEDESLIEDERRHKYPCEYKRKDHFTGDSPSIEVKAVLIPRPTSILVLLRFLSFLLVNLSLNFCMQTSGKPYEDTIRKLLDMDTHLSSKINPLQIYVAKKFLSSSASPLVDEIPPSYLPSPLPLLGAFFSICFCLGVTVLLPKWSIGAAIFLSYLKIDVKKDANGTREMLWNWFDQRKDIDFYQSSSMKQLCPAVLVTVVSSKSTGTICPLFISPGYKNSSFKTNVSSSHHKFLEHLRLYYFDFNGKRYYYDPSMSPALIGGGPDLSGTPVSELTSAKFTSGLHTVSRLSDAKERYYPYSHISIPIPTLTSAFVQRITSPLVMLQLVGRLMSIFEEETLGKSFANLARLGFQHLSDAKWSIEAATTLAKEIKENEGLEENSSSNRIWAVRSTNFGSKILLDSKGGKRKRRLSKNQTSQWVQVSPSELLPGDVFFIAPMPIRDANHGQNLNDSSITAAFTIPVDALLLEGTCVTEEAQLTGESVPQAKVPLDLALGDSQTDATLDMNGHHRSSCIFAGTKLLHSANDVSLNSNQATIRSKYPPIPDTICDPDNVPAIFLSVRSGSYSSRGDIMQYLLKNKIGTGAVTNKDNLLVSMRLIAVLGTFAAIACLCLIFDKPDIGLRDSTLKRIFQCTRIAVASVPSELPVSLSAIIRASAATLREETDGVCSKPGALLDSSKVDCIVFDKTGTLTADTQSLSLILYPPPHKMDLSDVSSESMSGIVLAGCHTLTGIDGMNSTIVGDPIDRASLIYSGWEFSSHDKTATFGSTKLWQIRSFPFDPYKKISSAIVLVRLDDGAFRLLVVTKGSPNKMPNKMQCSFNADHSDFPQWYNQNIKKLGQSGYRNICLGALEASDTEIEYTLFPKGLPAYGSVPDAVESIVQEARRNGRVVHRNDIELCPSNKLSGKSFSFVGFACFNAPVRRSTVRVVHELKNANIELKMLTGDDAWTSIATAIKTGFVSHQTNSSNVHILKLDAFGSYIWESNNSDNNFSLSMAMKIQRDMTKRGATFAIHGNAMNALLSDSREDKVIKFVRDKLLPQAALITNASPNDKVVFVHWLTDVCGRCVLMCGDGVNDVAAMTEAAVSVAMLSGFGSEAHKDSSAEDFDELLREERLKKRCIGGNRLNNALYSSLSDEAFIGVGDSLVAAFARIRHRISKEFHVFQHQQSNRPLLKVTPVEVIFSSILEEFRRFRKLRKGGTAAAKILAEEDLLRQSLRIKSSIFNETNTIDNSRIEPPMINTGEACLASSFTLLRPSVSGVEGIIRIGIAAAASCISCYRKVALNCMLSCYNLSTLYKNGVRYGKWMWQCELTSLVFVDRASFIASSTSRPTLVANVRPSSSPFNLDQAISITCQAIIHIVTLTLAVNNGKQLELLHPAARAHHGLKIKLTSSDSENTPSVGALLSTLVGTSGSAATSIDTEASSRGFFRKQPFQPNYVSNNVFVMSIFQNAVIALVNHPGMPFSIAFLESRPLCLSVGLSFLLCTVCIAGTFPILNKCLQLVPFPTKASKIAMLRLLILNLSMSYFAEYFSTFFFRHDVWLERNKQRKVQLQKIKSMTAADKEEVLLAEERRQNFVLMCVLCASILITTTEPFI